MPSGWGGRELRNHLITRHGVFVRECSNKLGKTSDFLRLVVRSAAEVERLVRGIEQYATRQHATLAARRALRGGVDAGSSCAAWHAFAVTTGPAATQHLHDLALLRRVRDRIDREYASAAGRRGARP